MSLVKVQGKCCFSKRITSKYLASFYISGYVFFIHVTQEYIDIKFGLKKKPTILRNPFRRIDSCPGSSWIFLALFANSDSSSRNSSSGSLPTIISPTSSPRKIPIPLAILLFLPVPQGFISLDY